MPNWQNFAESGCTEDYISLDEVLAIWFSFLIRAICYLSFYGDFINRNVNVINIFLTKSRLQQNFKNPNLFVLINTWWSVWPDLAKFHHFGKIVWVFGIILGVNLLLDNIFNLPTMPKYFMPLGKLSFFQMAKYWRNIFSIWSHCWWWTWANLICWFLIKWFTFNCVS